MNVACAVFLCDSAPRLWFEVTALRAVDGFAVNGEPLSHFAKTRRTDGINFACGHRTCVEQQIRAVTRSTHKEMYEFGGGFVSRIAQAETPRFVYGFAGFER